MKQITLTSILLGFWLCLPFLLSAQSSGIIKGELKDSKSNLPLEYATISIFSQTDSTLIAGEVTDAQGIYNITIPYGNYFGKIEFIAYHSQLIDTFSLTKNNPVLDLGEMRMSINSANLKEVEVMTAKGEMQMTLDKKVFNVSKDLSSAGGTAADILSNVPSVSVDAEGNPALRGNSGVQILIDGKPSSLVSGNKSGGLRQLPANLIDRVEVITNPSAKYEAEGTAGIINIILKKERKVGVNGSFDVTVGYPDIYGLSLNLNVRKDKINLFTNVGINYQKIHGGGGLYQEIVGDELAILDFERDHVLGGWSQNVRLGLDYFLNDNNTLTTAVSFDNENGKDDIEMTYRDFVGSTDFPLGIFTRLDNTTKKENNLEYALTFSHKFAKKGHSLVADVRYQDNNAEDASVLRGTFFDTNFQPLAVEGEDQRSGDEEGESRLITKLDYTLPLRKNEKLELGYQGSFRNIQNNFLVEELDDVDWRILPEVSNDFQYDENIIGGYGTYRNKVKMFSYQVGARVEYTDVVTELLGTNKTNPRSYTNFFPSAQMKVDLSKSDAIKMSYSRRVRRPTYNNLNPFFTYNDPRNQYRGNPDLNPEFTDSYELEYLKYWEKMTFSSAVFYRHRTDVIGRFLEQIDGDTTLLRSENYKSRDELGLDVTATFAPRKWLNLSANMVGYYLKNDASNLNPTYLSEGYTWRARLTSKIKIKKKTDVQIQFNYSAPKELPQGQTFYVAYVNLGVSRQFWNKKGKLTFGISDIANSYIWKSETDTPSIFRQDEFQWSRRTAKLTFSYRL